MRIRRTWVVAGALLLVLPLGGCTVTAGVASSPAPTVTVTVTPSPSASEVVVPLQVVHQGKATLAVVPVRVDGHGPYPFILDTGASTSGINKQLADQLELPKTGSQAQVSGVTGSDKVPLVRIDQWSVASTGSSTALQPTSIGALPFAMASGGNSQIAGLLGSDQLSRFGSITLDYQHQQLRFTTAAG